MEFSKGLVAFIFKVKEAKNIPGHFAFENEGNGALRHVENHSKTQWYIPEEMNMQVVIFCRVHPIVAHHTKIYMRTAINRNTFH
jgi:hypothetical protein